MVVQGEEVIAVSCCNLVRKSPRADAFAMEVILFAVKASFQNQRVARRLEHALFLYCERERIGEAMILSENRVAHSRNWWTHRGGFNVRETLAFATFRGLEKYLDGAVPAGFVLPWPLYSDAVAEKKAEVVARVRALCDGLASSEDAVSADMLAKCGLNGLTVLVMPVLSWLSTHGKERGGTAGGNGNGDGSGNGDSDGNGDGDGDGRVLATEMGEECEMSAGEEGEMCTREGEQFGGREAALPSDAQGMGCAAPSSDEGRAADAAPSHPEVGRPSRGHRRPATSGRQQQAAAPNMRKLRVGEFMTGSGRYSSKLCDYGSHLSPCTSPHVHLCPCTSPYVHLCPYTLPHVLGTDTSYP